MYATLKTNLNDLEENKMLADNGAKPSVMALYTWYNNHHDQYLKIYISLLA